MAESVTDLASGASSAATELIRAGPRFIVRPLAEVRPRMQRTPA
jgi:hypothetical protein